MAASSVPQKPSPEHIYEVFNAHHQTAALKAALELDLFTAIDEGNSSVEELAKCLSASQRGVRILSDYMTILGFLHKQEGCYALTQEAAMFLSRRSPAYMGTVSEFLTNERHYQNLARLKEAVRRGGTAGENGSNRVADDALWVSFARSMAPLAIPAASFIANLVEAQKGDTMQVLDIAAGHGMYGITLAQRNPRASITAVDWPAVLEVATEHAQKAGVADRYAVRPGSAFAVELGEGYDVVLLTNIFHHFDKETCAQLMRRVHQATKPGGKAITLEFVPNEDRVSPPRTAAFSLLMLVGTDAGDAYTFSEYDAIFKSAGFPATSLHPIPAMPQSVLISEKP